MILILYLSIYLFILELNLIIVLVKSNVIGLSLFAREYLGNRPNKPQFMHTSMFRRERGFILQAVPLTI